MYVISKYYSDDNSGFAIVTTDVDGYNIEYYDNNNHKFFEESYAGKSLHYVEDAAENWALGIKKLDI